jgi:hypothetical protein
VRSLTTVAHHQAEGDELDAETEDDDGLEVAELTGGRGRKSGKRPENDGKDVDVPRYESRSKRRPCTGE